MVAYLREHGMEVLEAVTEAVRLRLRPIMMSMITTVAARLQPGRGTELYRGLRAVDPSADAIE